MPLQDIHEAAESSTPPSVQIPASWPGLIVWAAGKWGVGIIFALMLYPLYTDLKASNQQFVESTKATVAVLNTMATKIEDFGRTTEANAIKIDLQIADHKRIEELLNRKQ